MNYLVKGKQRKFDNFRIGFSVECVLRKIIPLQQLSYTHTVYYYAITSISSLFLIGKLHFRPSEPTTVVTLS